MYDTTLGTDAVPSTWLDAADSGSTPSTLYGGKGGLQPSPPPPPPPVDESIVNGTNEDDTLQGSTGDNKLYGGKGEDTAVYRGVLDDYELSFDVDTWCYKLIDKVSGRDGSDLLNGVERLQFDGLTVLLDGQGGAHLEDGTEVLAPYVPPPGPEGGDLVLIAMPVEGDLVVAEPYACEMIPPYGLEAVGTTCEVTLVGFATTADTLTRADG